MTLKGSGGGSALSVATVKQTVVPAQCMWVEGSPPETDFRRGLERGGM